MMDEFVQDFLVEGSELLDQLDRNFVEFEKNPDSKELVAQIFRAIHTLKGTSGTIGLKKIEAVNHAGENILSRLREGKLSINSEITSALLAMIDVNRQLFASLESTGQEGDLDPTAIIATLTSVLARSTAGKLAADANSCDGVPSPNLLGEISGGSRRCCGSISGRSSECSGDMAIRDGWAKSWCRAAGPYTKMCRRRCKHKLRHAKMSLTAISASM